MQRKTQRNTTSYHTTQHNKKSHNTTQRNTTQRNAKKIQHNNRQGHAKDDTWKFARECLAIQEGARQGTTMTRQRHDKTGDSIRQRTKVTAASKREEVPFQCLVLSCLALSYLVLLKSGLALSRVLSSLISSIRSFLVSFSRKQMWQVRNIRHIATVRCEI